MRIVYELSAEEISCIMWLNQRYSTSSSRVGLPPRLINRHQVGLMLFLQHVVPPEFKELSSEFFELAANNIDVIAESRPREVLSNIGVRWDGEVRKGMIIVPVVYVGRHKRRRDDK